MDDEWMKRGGGMSCSVRERERFLLQLQAFQEQFAVQEQSRRRKRRRRRRRRKELNFLSFLLSVYLWHLHGIIPFCI
jgi:hypothetical protein